MKSAANSKSHTQTQQSISYKNDEETANEDNFNDKDQGDSSSGRNSPVNLNIGTPRKVKFGLLTSEKKRSPDNKDRRSLKI